MTPFHPETIARARAHTARRSRCDASPARKAAKGQPAQPAMPCTCVPDPADLAGDAVHLRA